jgi:hypothetical protein
VLGERGRNERDERISLVNIDWGSNRESRPVPWTSWFGEDNIGSSIVVEHCNSEVVLEERETEDVGKGHLDEVVSDTLIRSE